ncbi:MAG: VC1465 family Xer recombination activation factor [Polaromonas sp.]
MRQCPADRAEHAKRFRALLADLGLKHLDAAKLLHVSLRTLQNWLSGRHEAPYAAYKLLRLLRYMELPGASWDGWHFSRGGLVTPEGRMISGKDGAWWSLLVRQSRGFSSLYTELQALRTGAPTPEGPRLRGVAGDGAKGLAVPFAGCYAESCSSEKSLQPATPEVRCPPMVITGITQDNGCSLTSDWYQSDTITQVNKRLAFADRYQSDTISAPWPLLFDFLPPSNPTPLLTAGGLESASTALSASHLTPICNGLSRCDLSSLPPLPLSLPLRLSPSSGTNLSFRPLSASLIQSLCFRQSPQRPTAPSFPPGTDAIRSPEVLGVAP